MGFDLVGVSREMAPGQAQAYRTWVEAGYGGKMAYLARPDALARRADMQLTLPEATSLISVGVSYFVKDLPAEIRHDPARGLIARYAWGQDYHDVLAPRLQVLGTFLAEECGTPVLSRPYVDTGPLLERNLAHQAGLGFIGRNTMLINPDWGSYLFLGELITTAELESDKPDSRGTCGHCTRCLAACPTEAFVAPYVLDARRCISYLTIELKGPIPRELRSLMGNWIFGCDVCQEVCPWTRKFSRVTRAPAFQPDLEAVAPLLLPLIGLTPEGFRARFKNSPVARAKRRGLLRNVAVALGNWGDGAAVPALNAALQDPEPLVRGHVAWALGRMGEYRRLQAAREWEQDGYVLEEIGAALG
ncbi:MAG: tRNA epoxyqueuosine(34) reductase QueG [Chloroflexi bacterium]|nr:tRNA epoxyqueuosine(34) reductase QueG [Chloroflexota bacterium]